MDVTSACCSEAVVGCGTEKRQGFISFYPTLSFFDQPCLMIVFATLGNPKLDPSSPALINILAKHRHNRMALCEGKTLSIIPSLLTSLFSSSTTQSRLIRTVIMHIPT
jgi:hypothetical protein